MAYLKQSLKLSHKLDDSNVISSEIEFECADDETYLNTLNEVRWDLVKSVSNEQPKILTDCIAAMGLNFSKETLKKLEKRYQDTCEAIKELDEKISANIMYADALHVANNNTNDVQEFMNLLLEHSSELADEFSKLLEKNKEILRIENDSELPHLKLPLVSYGENEVAEIISNGIQAD
ncbi:MAG: hypothetical protein AAGJ08_01775 [Cyanobacteria bacterium P01_H01_bin.35]